MGEGTWKVVLQVARGFYVFYQSKLQEVEIVSISSICQAEAEES